MSAAHHIYGLGNALMDIEYVVDEDFLTEQGQEKSQMALVDASSQEALLAALEHLTPNHSPGGSAANTALAVAGFGGSSFYGCRVADDAAGRAFIAGMNEAGVQTSTQQTGPAAAPTGKCLIMITPDGERTMATCLGISEQLDNTALNFDALAKSEVAYIEGYLASSETGSAAANLLRERAEVASVKTALTLSDVSMVQFFRDNMTAMLGNGVDYLFCNQEEAFAWAGTDRLDIAANELQDIAPNFVITLSEKGCLLQAGNKRSELPGVPTKVVDTTGAGDVFAGAWLYGLTHGMAPEQAATLANRSASKLVAQYGARLSVSDLRTLLKNA